jgi:hypothetical protein
LDGNKLQGAKESELPSQLVSLSIQDNKLTALDGLSLPDSLVVLDLSGNSLQQLSGIDLPAKLQSFTCENCQVTQVSGVYLPAQISSASSSPLGTFDLTGSTLSAFEVANASVAILDRVTNLSVTTSFTSCEDSDATFTTVQDGVGLCVLSDSAFAAKYASSQSGSDTAAASPAATGDDGSGGMNKWMLLAIISVSVLLGVVLSGFAFVLYRRHQRNKADVKAGLDGTLNSSAAPTDHTWVDVADGQQPQSASAKATDFVAHHNNTLTRTARTDSVPSTHHKDSGNGSNGTVLALSNSSTEYLSNDIRTDEDMLRFRLLQEEVALGALIAQGGYGAVYLATFRQEQVVVKQLLPDKARHKRTLANFMDEIRLAAALDHPKVVHFIGVTWSSLLDVSMVMEYMPRGDLSALLFAQLQREARDPLARDAYSWFHAFDGALLKCKSLLALDVAEALVYLHSFENPIIHRDLKPKNVLLSDAWVAKLTDFGVSREMTGEGEDQTMTGEVGTISWIAPEVLRGERYSVKADVYSFGVLLTELDTCRRPYSEGVAIPGSDTGDVEGDLEARNQPTNTRIAVLVSAGSLKPTVAPDCPRSVRSLVDKCLSFDPRERPSAVQIHFELRNLELGAEELSASGVRLTRAMSRPS